MGWEGRRGQRRARARCSYNYVWEIDFAFVLAEGFYIFVAADRLCCPLRDLRPSVTAVRWRLNASERVIFAHSSAVRHTHAHIQTDGHTQTHSHSQRNVHSGRDTRAAAQVHALNFKAQLPSCTFLCLCEWVNINVNAHEMRVFCERQWECIRMTHVVAFAVKRERKPTTVQLLRYSCS